MGFERANLAGAEGLWRAALQVVVNTTTLGLTPSGLKSKGS
jgi:hypothetical protein